MGAPKGKKEVEPAQPMATRGGGVGKEWLRGSCALGRAGIGGNSRVKPAQSIATLNPPPYDLTLQQFSALCGTNPVHPFPGQLVEHARRRLFPSSLPRASEDTMRCSLGQAKQSETFVGVDSSLIRAWGKGGVA